MVQSHLQLAVKLRTGTSKTKKMQICLDEVALFWMSQWTACSPAWRILYHVTASCKCNQVICLYYTSEVFYCPMKQKKVFALKRSLIPRGLYTAPIWPTLYCLLLQHGGRDIMRTYSIQCNFN